MHVCHDGTQLGHHADSRPAEIRSIVPRGRKHAPDCCHGSFSGVANRSKVNVISSCSFSGRRPEAPPLRQGSLVCRLCTIRSDFKIRHVSWHSHRQTRGRRKATPADQRAPAGVETNASALSKRASHRPALTAVGQPRCNDRCCRHRRPVRDDDVARRPAASPKSIRTR